MAAYEPTDEECEWKIDEEEELTVSEQLMARKRSVFIRRPGGGGRLRFKRRDAG